MGNILVVFYRLRCEYTTCPNSAAVRSRGKKIQSCPLVPADQTAATSMLMDCSTAGCSNSIETPPDTLKKQNVKSADDDAAAATANAAAAATDQKAKALSDSGSGDTGKNNFSDVAACKDGNAAAAGGDVAAAAAMAMAGGDPQQPATYWYTIPGSAEQQQQADADEENSARASATAGRPPLYGSVSTTPRDADLGTPTSSTRRRAKQHPLQPPRLPMAAPRLRACMMPAASSDAQQQQQQSSSVLALVDDGEDEMGPMDCADAFTYFYAAEGTYAHLESAVYRSPAVVSYTTQELRDAYVLGEAVSAEEQRELAKLAAAPHAQQGIEEAAAASTSHNNLSMSLTGTVMVGAASTLTAVGGCSTDNVNNNSNRTKGLVFTSLVDELKLQCARQPEASAVAWRRVDRTTAINNKSDKASSRSSSDGGGSDAGVVRYMGPSQSLSYGTLWMRVEAFGWGLRSLGLKPGDAVGLLEDTRWEWIVTCYACWTQGYVPVVCHDTSRCMERFASEVGPDLKACICKQSLVPVMRKHLRSAAIARQLAAAPPSPPQTDAMLVTSPVLAAAASSSSTPRKPGAAGGEGDSPSSSAEAHTAGILSSSVAQTTTALVAAAADAREEELLQLKLPPGSASRKVKPSRTMPLFVTIRQDPHVASSTTTTASSATTHSRASLKKTSPQRHEENEEEEESLWWTDVLEHGESKLAEARVRLHREERMQRLPPHLRQPAAASKVRSSNKFSVTRTSDLASAIVVGAGGRAVSAVPGRVDPLHALSGSALSAAAAQSRANTAPPIPQPQHGGGYQGRRRAGSTSLPTSFSTAAAGSIEPMRLRPTDLAMIVYTEGDPKGVMLTHGALKASAAGYAERFTDMQLHTPQQESEHQSTADGGVLKNASFLSVGIVAGNNTRRRGDDNTGRQGASYLAYRPLHHVLEFILESVFLCEGVTVCYGSPETLLNTHTKPHGDLTEFKPTIMCAVPEFLDQLRNTVESTLTSGYSKLLFEVGYEERRLALRACLDTPYLNEAVFKQPRQLLGGRCELVLSCGAPLHPGVQEYVQVVCGTAISQVYSLTEAAGSGFMQEYWSGHLDSIGGPLGPVEVKLRDADGWCHHTPRPCGEMLLRGPVVMSGYYCQPERTADVLEGSGWLHTGDVGERKPDGTFRIAARLQSSMKTSAGQCVPLETLERLYGEHPLATQPHLSVCVLVNPYRPYICALVLTNEARTRAFLADPETVSFLAQRGAAENPLLHRWPYCLREPAFNEAVAASLNAFGAAKGLKHHERLQHVRVLYDSWSAQNGLRTATGKLRRSAVVERNHGVVEELFAL